MALENYAYIKNGQVVNVAVFDSPSEELLSLFKTDLELDDLILATEKAVVGSTWNGTVFTLPKPYPSWTLNEQNDWEAPIPYPEEGGPYDWNETSQSWDIVPPRFTPDE